MIRLLVEIFTFITTEYDYFNRFYSFNLLLLFLSFVEFKITLKAKTVCFVSIELAIIILVSDISAYLRITELKLQPSWTKYISFLIILKCQVPYTVCPNENVYPSKQGTNFYVKINGANGFSQEYKTRSKSFRGQFSVLVHVHIDPTQSIIKNI